MRKIGFIGCGNMALAMIGGIIGKEITTPDQIHISNQHPEKRKMLEQRLGVTGCENNSQVVKESDVIVIAVKPQYYAQVIQEVAGEANASKLFISIAPGKTLSWLKEQFACPVKIARAMPNTPAMVGEGMTAVSFDELLTEDEKNTILEILGSCGKTEVVPEHLMDAVTAVSGSSPAYVYMFIEAMADAAVAEGMPRAQSYRFAAQAVLGSAKMVLESGRHPGELKDMVCSPAGTTIQAVRVLEEKGFRSAVMEAMITCAEKSKGM